MPEVKNGLLTNNYTRVFHEDDHQYYAPHHFYVEDKEGVLLGNVDFQCGAIKEHGVNGVMNEDVIVMVITRLEHFQQSPFACRENAIAITKLQESLMWLRKRTMDREARGVEGTHVK